MNVNLFIAGFSKCGTSSMFDMLQQFDQIEVGTSKEPKFFSKALGYDETGNLLDWANGGNYNKGFDWYRTIFRNADPKAKYFLDASTIYGFDSETPKLIYDHNPDAKLIFMVRDPYKRIEAHYFQEVKFGMKLPPFEDFIESNHPRLNFFKKVTKYKATLNQYLQYFPKDQMKVISLKEFQENLNGVMEELGHFLDLKLPEIVDDQHSNSRRVPKFANLKRFLVNIERSKVASAMPRSVQELGSTVMRKVDKVILKDVKEKPGISETTINKINQEFKEDFEFLEKAFGVKL